VLTIHAALSGAFACFAEIDDGLHRVLGVDLNLVEAVLNDCGGHGVPC